MEMGIGTKIITGTKTTTKMVKNGITTGITGTGTTTTRAHQITVKSGTMDVTHVADNTLGDL
jgi:hypothetical protein